MLHSWDDDNDQYEILGLRKLLREAVTSEAYARASPAHCRQLGMTEFTRISNEDNHAWHRTFSAFKQEHGRAPTYLEHEALLVKEKSRVP